MRSNLFLCQDEIGNLGRVVTKSYSQLMSIWPAWYYNDRPIGFMVEKLLFDLFGYAYVPQLMAFLVFHFANCGLVYVLFRRLGLSVLFSIAGLAVFGGAWTTAHTATYIGAVFDVVCLFCMLLSTLTLLSGHSWSMAVSAIFYFLAVRTKEFAIVLPLMFTVLLVCEARPLGIRPTFRVLAQRLWAHYAIAFVIVVSYARFATQMRVLIRPENPYYMDLSVASFCRSLTYYTTLVFGWESPSNSVLQVVLPAALAAIGGLAILRRNTAIAFAAASYVLTLSPVAFLVNQRADPYVYAPQVFLILLIGALIEEGVAGIMRLNGQWWMAAGLSAASVASMMFFRESQYYEDRINFTLAMRQACRRTAEDVSRQLLGVPDGASIYIQYGSAKPWLFDVGNCDYVRLVNDYRAIRCISGSHREQLLGLYNGDQGLKYLVDYHADGTFTTLESGHPAGAAQAPTLSLQ